MCHFQYINFGRFLVWKRKIGKQRIIWKMGETDEKEKYI